MQRTTNVILQITKCTLTLVAIKVLQPRGYFGVSCWFAEAYSFLAIILYMQCLENAGPLVSNAVNPLGIVHGNRIFRERTRHSWKLSSDFLGKQSN